MNNRVLKVLVLLVVLSLVLGVGAIAGGGIVYALTQIRDVIPVAKAQVADPDSGIVIASVVSESPAAEASVTRGDILLEIDSEALERPSDMVRYLDERAPGDQVELTVLHGDDLHTLTATLGDRDGRAYLGLVPCGGLPRAVDVYVGGVSGAIILKVMPDSPAEDAGLQVGDVIVAVDDRGLDAENTLADLVAEYEPGDMVTLEIEGPGEEAREVMVELGQHPDDEDVAYLGVRYRSFPYLRVLRGESLDGLPFGRFDEFDFDKLPFIVPNGDVEQGAIVWRVYEDSPASAAGLEEGDVITAIDGESVSSPQSLIDALAEREPGDRVTLTVYLLNEGKEREIEIALGEHPDQEGRAYVGVGLGRFFRMEHSRGDKPFRRLDLFVPPFVPHELLPPFEFPWHWSPRENCDGWPGCPGEGI